MATRDAWIFVELHRKRRTLLHREAVFMRVHSPASRVGRLVPALLAHAQQLGRRLEPLPAGRIVRIRERRNRTVGVCEGARARSMRRLMRRSGQIGRASWRAQGSVTRQAGEVLLRREARRLALLTVSFAERRQERARRSVATHHLVGGLA
jgi:hypothetical protein